MALVSIFQNRLSKDIVLVPYASDKELGGGSRATGPLEYLSQSQFESTGVVKIQQYLDEFSTRDYCQPSELYNTFSDQKRLQFLSEHKQVNVFRNPRLNAIKVYAKEELFKTLPPVVDDTTVKAIIEAFRVSP